MTPLQSWARLTRLVNLPTALADIALGALATDALPDRWPAFGLLLLASGALYSSGMVWNDVFDAEQDYRERPDRPIPSGQISRRAAALGGGLLMLVGVACAALVGGPPAVVAGLLVAAVFLYDGWLKRTALGPIAMGTCRFLNVLLGVSVTGTLAWPLGPHLALVVGLYIVGVTWFARTEARESHKVALAAAAGVMLAALAVGLAVPVHKPEGTSSPAFVPLLVALGFWLGFPLHRAVVSPTPANVQSGVKRSLMGLILLDAALAAGAAGTSGLLILLLLAPSLYLNRKRWLYAT
ncbi:MAG: UbiA family prenyltransferase [Gemmataceae bacterium]